MLLENHKGTEFFGARQNSVPEHPDAAPARATSHRTFREFENVIKQVVFVTTKTFFRNNENVS